MFPFRKQPSKLSSQERDASTATDFLSQESTAQGRQLDNDFEKIQDILTNLAARNGFSVRGESFQIIQQENYTTSGCCGTLMKRFILQDDNRRLPLVIKKPLSSKRKNDLNIKQFRNEFTFYSHVSNRIADVDASSNNMLASGSCLNMCGFTKQPHADNFFPRFPLIYASDLSAGNEYLVLEDLEDHEPVTPPDNMDKKHLKAAIIGLATFHSACLKWKIRNPSEYHTVTKMFSETELFGGNSLETAEYNQTRKMTTSLNEALRICSANLPSSYKVIMEKICDLAPSECSSWVVPEKAEPWSTITHGDCWAKHFLFKYDKHKKIVGVAMVDFKCVRSSSPLMDVANLLLSSASVECLRDLRPFIEKHRETMFPKMPDYRQHIALAGAYGLITSLIHHYFCILFPSPDVDLAIQLIADNESSSKGTAAEERVVLIIKAARDLRMI